MALTIESFVGGPIETNAFLVSDDESREAIVVDAPMDVAERIDRAAKTAELRITLIVITHTHWDHIGDAAELKELTGAPLAAHELAVDALANPGSATTDLPFTIPPAAPDKLLADGDEVRLGEHVFRVLHLPGHEPAHIALLSEADRMFLGGDVLFPNGHGRVDIPGADQETMNRSLARLVDLPPDTVV
ncbi:MAG TPA: MBL fold metallo-hydrolase, partial [Thermomicrobiales bacterium]|nr:MBL fold metallo-hydrolase [Thermomicrobiales bacterium]